jgi:hypothetical protein
MDLQSIAGLERVVAKKADAVAAILMDPGNSRQAKVTAAELLRVQNVADSARRTLNQLASTSRRLLPPECVGEPDSDGAA